MPSKPMRALAALLAMFMASAMLSAAEYHGQVNFGPVPAPGAVVTAAQGAQKLSALTDAGGVFSFADLPGDVWQLGVEMSGFAPAVREIRTSEAPVSIELHMLPFSELKARVNVTSAAPAPAATQAEATQTEATQAEAPKKQDAPSAFAGLDHADLAQRATDGMLINGSANNGAASPFQIDAFGNNRRTGKSLYNGSLGMILDAGAWDARSYSLTGQNTPQPNFYHLQGLASFGGPIRIPHVLRNGPNITITYQWTRNRNITTQSGLVPTLDQRAGDGLPLSLVSPQALALLQLYPLPQLSPNPGGGRYNYQTSLTGATHDDSLQMRFQQRLTTKNQLSGNLSYQSTRTDATSLFGFLDATRTTGLNTGINWMHTFHSRLYSLAGLQFSRLSLGTDPFFARRRNISSDAGITGNNQDPANWGPPALSFASGIASLNDAQFSRAHNQNTGASAEIGWNHERHYLTFGGDYRRQQWNSLGQQDPRGSFSFTGPAAFQNFLLGIPDASSIAFGNADKYFRSWSSDAYLSDDWRWKPNLTLTLGVRWEYTAPIDELYHRLVNLAVAPGFTSATAVTGDGLLHPDRNNFAPRLAFALRPIPASSLVIRGGYGIYYDTSIYQWIATQMAQQPPFSTSLRVQNTPANALTLANGFHATSNGITNTFGVDPNFRVGYAQNWELSLQRDLPRGLVLLASYSGVKGTRAQQQFLPNTYPAGIDNPCPACPTGFSYLTSNGNSIRHAGDLEIRRRLRNGLSAAVHYTWSKSIDNAALGGRNQGGALTAQDWLDLSAERALSNFDQRHLVTLTTQYTTGMGLGGGTLLGGWRGRAFKEWTVTNRITAGSGLPLTPLYFATVQGTGVVGSLRPDYTGAPLYSAPPGLFLNPAAFAPPAAGHWGNAGRDSITGPSQFNFNASLGRTFRAGDRWSIDFRVDAANALNHPVFSGWNTLTNSSQFGLPLAANPMRSLQTTIRARF